MSAGKTIPTPGPSEGLVVVDLQNDFLPGGALAVSGGDQVVGVLNRWIEAYTEAGRPVVLTRDWHPPDHCSFRAQGGPWPPHCVAGTPGAEFAPGLARPGSAIVVSKATEPEAEAYSGFQGTGLADRLRGLGVEKLYVGGLATDYCVLETVSDALSEGFEVEVILPAIRAVEAEPGDGRRALRRMETEGARIRAA